MPTPRARLFEDRASLGAFLSDPSNLPKMVKVDWLTRNGNGAIPVPAGTRPQDVLAQIDARHRAVSRCRGGDAMIGVDGRVAVERGDGNVRTSGLGQVSLVRREDHRKSPQRVARFGGMQWSVLQ